MASDEQISAALQSQDFLGLSTIEKRKFLLDVSPDFKGLPLKEQSKFVESLTGRDLPKPQRGPFMTRHPTVASVAETATGSLPYVGAAAGAAAGTPFDVATGPFGSIGGAMVGGAGGTALKQIANRALGLGAPGSSAEAAGEIGSTGLAQGAAEMGGQAVAPIVRGVARRLPSAVREIPLRSGETVRTTPGIRNPSSSLARFESGAASLPGGFPLRNFYEKNEVEAARQIITGMAGRSTGARVVATEPAQAFNQASLAARQLASPLHESVKAAMSVPSAAEPTADAIASAARKELENLSLQSLLSKPELAAAVRSNLERMAETRLVSGGPELPPGQAFQVFKDARSNLMELARSKSLSRSERRIVGNAVRALDGEVANTIRHVGGPQLEATWREANRLTAQSYALEELRDALRAATKGTEPAAQAAGLPAQATKVKAGALVESLKKLATVDDPQAGLSTLQKALGEKDAATIRQLADVMERQERLSGTGNIAAKFRVLEGVTLVGGIALGHPGSAISAAALPEVGAYIFAKAMTSQPGRSALLRYMISPAGAANEIRLAEAVNHYATKSDEN